MSHETDRIAVPPNGRKPHRVAEASHPAAEAVADGSTDADPAAPDPVAKATSPELTIAVTPAQLAVGFGVIAGIILLVLGRRRGRRKG